MLLFKRLMLLLVWLVVLGVDWSAHSVTAQGKELVLVQKPLSLAPFVRIKKWLPVQQLEWELEMGYYCVNLSFSDQQLSRSCQRSKIIHI